MWTRSPRLALSRRTFHYPRVDLDTNWNQCGHGRRSWHFLGVPFTIRKWIWAKIKQRGHYRMRIWTNIEQSGHYRGQNRTKIEQSGHYRGPDQAKWALSGVDVVQGWIWTHYRRVKMDDSTILSTMSRGQVGNSQHQAR